MNKEIIKDIENLLSHTFKERDSAGLHELLWSIDAKHHLIPTVDEINLAFEKIKGIKIYLENDIINLIYSTEAISDKLTQEQIDLAMNYNRKYISQIKNKYK